MEFSMQLNDVSQNYDVVARYYDRLTDLVFGRILGLETYRRHTIRSRFAAVVVSAL